MKELKHLKYGPATCLKKRSETFETQHRRTAMIYLVGNCGGAGLPFVPTARGGWGRRRMPPLLPLPRRARWIGAALDVAWPHAPAMLAVSRGRGDAARSREGAAGRGRGGSAACLILPTARQRLARAAMAPWSGGERPSWSGGRVTAAAPQGVEYVVELAHRFA